MKKKTLATIAAMAGFSLALTACGGGAADENADNGAGIDKDAIVTTNGVEPQHELVSTNTGESGGGKVIDITTAGLVYYTVKGEPKLDLAESIESTDSKVYKIKLKKGIQFSDGSPITSDSFIKAWEYGANPKNGQYLQSFFTIIEGAPSDEEASAEQVPDVPTLSGLKKIDDQNFEVTLKEPVSDFQTRLGYSAFMPMPEVELKDPTAFGQNPTVSSGPYVVKDGGWKHEQSIEVVRNDKYTGPRKAKNGGVTFKIYNQDTAAYADVQSGQLDMMDGIPTANLRTFETDFPDSHISEPTAVWQSFVIPNYIEHFANDEEGNLRRQAISMAIDRKLLVKTIFFNQVEPARDFSSPALSNYKEVLELTKDKGNIEFNKDKAKELWKKADAIKPWSGKFTLAYNADASHKDWVDGVTNQIKNNLGIEAEGAPYPTFKELRQAIQNKQMTGAFRSGWMADYPEMSNFLEPLYVTGAASNDGGYSNKEFDKLIVEINKTQPGKEKNELYAQAQDILDTTLPAVPLWYGKAKAVWNAGAVKNVKVLWNSQPAYYLVEKLKKD